MEYADIHIVKITKTYTRYEHWNTVLFISSAYLFKYIKLFHSNITYYVLSQIRVFLNFWRIYDNYYRLETVCTQNAMSLVLTADLRQAKRIRISLRKLQTLRMDYVCRISYLEHVCIMVVEFVKLYLWCERIFDRFRAISVMERVVFKFIAVGFLDVAQWYGVLLDIY